MTTFEYKSYISTKSATEEDDGIWEMLDQRIFSDESIDNRIFNSWED